MITRLRPLLRAAFWVYALALFVATHWPALTVPIEGRPDLFIHTAVFGLWAALLIAAAYFGPPLSARNILPVLLVATIYAAIDEGLQAIPFIRRTAALDDWAANVLGIILACVLAAGLGWLTRRPPPSR